MRKAEHTPGPLSLPTADNPDFGGSVVLDDRGYLVADFNISCRDEAECHANALLFIAAPEMLAASKRLVAAHNACLGDNPTGEKIAEHCMALLELQAAIAKAEGRAL